MRGIAWISRFRFDGRKSLTWEFVPVLSMVYPFELDPRGITESGLGGVDNRCDMKAVVRLGAEKS